MDVKLGIDGDHDVLVFQVTFINDSLHLLNRIGLADLRVQHDHPAALCRRFDVRAHNVFDRSLEIHQAIVLGLAWDCHRIDQVNCGDDSLPIVSIINSLDPWLDVFLHVPETLVGSQMAENRGIVERSSIDREQRIPGKQRYGFHCFMFR